MSEAIKQQAVIYARVSSQAQFEKGDGLESQATRCREFAKYKGLEVIQTFQDTKSGSLIDRPGMQTMLKFLRKHRKEKLVVIIDDLSRLARGLEAHLQLRAAIAATDAMLMSPSIEFGEDSDSMLVENLLASVSQHQRQKNAEQTKNRMRARMMNGFWVHPVPPIGYRYEKTKDRGKVLVRDEPWASIVQEALESYASGRFQLQSEVKRFLESFPEFPRDSRGQVRNQQVHDILTRVIYTGYLESEAWDISLRPAQHEGLISFETHRKIQKRLQENAKVPARKNLNEDFPLRGFITCGDCGHPMTACWSKGKTKHHPYYMCFKKGCESYRKSIRGMFSKARLKRSCTSSSRLRHYLSQPGPCSVSYGITERRCRKPVASGLKRTSPTSTRKLSCCLIASWRLILPQSLAPMKHASKSWKQIRSK